MAEDPTDDLCLEQLFRQKETEDFDEVVAQKLQSSQVTTEKTEQSLYQKPEAKQKPENCNQVSPQQQSSACK